MEEDDGFIFTRKSRTNPKAKAPTNTGKIAPAQNKGVSISHRRTVPNASEALHSGSFRSPVSSNRSRNDFHRHQSHDQRWPNHHHVDTSENRSDHIHTPSHTRQATSCRKTRLETRQEDRDDPYQHDDRPYTPDYDHTQNQRSTPRTQTNPQVGSSRRSGVHDHLPHPPQSVSQGQAPSNSSRKIRDRSQRVSSRPQYDDVPTPRGKDMAPIQSTPSIRTPNQRNIETPRSSGKSHKLSVRGGGDSSILSESSISDLRIDVPDNIPSESERLRHLLTASMSMVLDHYRAMDSNSYKLTAAEKICQEFIESDPCEIGSLQREVLPNPMNIERQTLLDQYQVPLDRLLAERAQWHMMEERHRSMATTANQDEVEQLSRDKLYADRSLHERINREQSSLMLKVEQISQTTKSLEYLERSGRDALNADADEPSGDNTATTTIPNTRIMTNRTTPASEKKTPRRLIRGIIDL
ncbi:hypothetical protein SARC_03059 [Sphaeroforma arctica JP610]|uniref:Uncharacterized protein n=1 Tax=Sphaeroforma arctica JP610 TaxID=667725 RepID=A0A0L0G8Z9_9EUKA|nr:hypothetical protein SARC_03059 [Sphaeroforma arctica JP610]KNC84718.1 hypothetical protein SARC_03059 [Sphaeroforma arctica JP610]|eukprot:XP_014158620.1 hypothetical protein SARC_03059 [Sphaeroforma arctica JP610]